MASSLANPILAATSLFTRTFNTTDRKTVRLGSLVADVTILVVPSSHQANVTAVSYDTAVEEGEFDKGTARALVIEQRNVFATPPRIVLSMPSNMNLNISNQFRGHLRAWGRLKRALTFALRHGASLRADGAAMVLGTVANGSQLVVNTVTGEASIGANGGYAHLQHVGGSAFAHASEEGVVKIGNALKGVTMDVASQGKITVGNQLYT